MPEYAVTISKKQHDLVRTLQEQQVAVGRQLETVCNTIVMGSDETFPPSMQVVGVRNQDGVYQLVLQSPDDAVPQEGSKSG